MPQAPFISVIVPVYNDVERLEGLLFALDAQSLPKSQWDVVIADNNSTDCPEKVVDRFSFARLVTETKVGSYAARNRAMQHAKGEILAFTDSDCLPHVDWLENALTILSAKNAPDAIAGRFDVFANNPQSPTLAEQYEMLFAFPQRYYAETLKYGATGNMVTWAKFFDEIGPFDPNLKSGGDENWGQRLTAKGYRVAYADNVCVKHPARTWHAMKAKIDRVAGGKYARLMQQKQPQLKVVLKLLALSLPPIDRWIKIIASPRSMVQPPRSMVQPPGSLINKVSLMAFSQYRYWYGAGCLFREACRNRFRPPHEPPC